MRRLVLAAAVLGGACLLAADSLSQEKSDTKAPELPKKPEPPKKPEGPKLDYPKEILGKNLDAWVRDMHVSNQADPSIRELAIKTVPLFGPSCRKVASSNLLFALTKDPDYSVRLTALAMVPSIGFEGTADIDAGIKTMIGMATRSEQNHTRYEAIMALSNCGIAARRAVPAILQFAVNDSTSWQIRKAAVYTLGRIDFDEERKGPGAETLSALVGRATYGREPAALVRREAVQSILVLTPPVPSTQALRELRKALIDCKKDPDKSVGIWARVCLMRLETDRVKASDPNLRELMAMFKNPDQMVRIEAIQGIGTMGSEVKIAVPELMSVVDHDDDLTCKVNGIWALSQMGASAEELIPYLDKLKKTHREEIIRKAAEEALNTLTGKKEEEKKEKEAKKEMEKKDTPKQEAPKKD
jgi:HEAT repeat protein